MRFGSRLSTAAAILVGGLLGWLAANAQFDPGAHANAGRQSERRTTSEDPASCCETGGGRACLLALAPAEKSAQQTGAGKKPNILVIFGDDIGQTNISAYSMGLMGYRTPNIDRIAREGMIFTDYYAEQSCTAGRSSFITGQCTFRTGLSKVGVPACAGRPAEGGPDHRRAAQAARLRDRAVRQEPPRRPERVPADRPRVRRVLRQPLSPQRRGRAGAADVPARPRVQARCSARAACSGARPRTRTTRPSIRGSGGSASRRSRIPARSPRSGWRRSTTRPRTRPSTTSSGRPGPASRSSAGTTAPGCTSAPTSPPSAAARRA